MSAVFPYGFYADHAELQLFHSRLDGLSSYDNWRAICETTPGAILGIWFPGPNSCDDWVRSSFSNWLWVKRLMEPSDRVRTASGVSGLRKAGHVNTVETLITIPLITHNPSYPIDFSIHQLGGRVFRWKTP